MENNEVQTKKINFFKKLWYSIARISKYEEMRNEGIGRSISYFFGLLAIFSLLISEISANIHYSSIDILTENVSFSYYLGVYFGYYFVRIGLFCIFCILLISFFLWLMAKISKKIQSKRPNKYAYTFDWNFRKAFMNAVYSSTLAMIIYILCTIISYFAKITINYIDIIYILVIYIYIFILINKDRKDFQNDKKAN